MNKEQQKEQLKEEALNYAVEKKQIPTDFKKGTFYFDRDGLINFNYARRRRSTCM